MEWIETVLERYHTVNATSRDSEDEYEQAMEENAFKSPLLSHDTDYNAPTNIAIFLPYLHWETSRKRAKMAQIVQEAVEGSKAFVDVRFMEVARDTVPCLSPKFDRGKIKNKIARYFYDVAQV
ncbi:hypothetical protein V8C35DRAFT_276649 [Trichoderma chlorosporum]